jgi:nitrate reductase assembly molybdenum cofactor insertion protein NarJ
MSALQESVSLDGNIRDRRASFLLASLLSGYPDENFGEYVGILLDDPELSCPDALKSRVMEFVHAEGALDELRSDYIELFDRGQAANPLYETEYGRDRALAKGRELADLAGFYKAFGLEIDGQGTSREMLDHVAVELEFYALLLLKQEYLEEQGDREGMEIVFDARRKFMADHLGRFVGAIAGRPGVTSSDSYSSIFGWCRELIDEECRDLGVSPDQAGWVQGQAENETMACGTSNDTSANKSSLPVLS